MGVKRSWWITLRVGVDNMTREQAGGYGLSLRDQLLGNNLVADVEFNSADDLEAEIMDEDLEEGGNDEVNPR